MTVTLYNSPGERNLLNRTMTKIVDLENVEITEPCNIETPEILIDRNDTYINCDYVYIPAFSRYYFRNDIRIENGNQFRLFLESDPLTSFRSSIMSSRCVARRSTNRINPEIVDNQVVFKTIPKRDYRKAATGFNPTGTGGCYILTLGGK